MTSLRHLHPPADPRPAFGPDDVAAALGITPALLRALIHLAATAQPSALPATSQSRLAYSPAEICDLTGLSRDIINDLIRTGQLGSIKAGRRRLISRAHLEAFLRGDAA